MAFLERRDDAWSCFLVTAPAEGCWQGYYSFRSSDGETESDEVRTAVIFIEASEAEIHERSRSLGRPLLLGLLESALHARENARLIAQLLGQQATRAQDERDGGCFV